MTRFVDSIIAYRILKLLTTPFNETEAFKLGIIDERGKELKKMSQLNTAAERDAYSILHRLVFRIKRMVEKIPIENKKFLSFAAALSLIKECHGKGYEPIDLENQFIDRLSTNNLTEELVTVEKYFSKYTMSPFKAFYEDAPANNIAATPGIAGATPETLGVRRRKKVFRRKTLGF